MTKGPVWLNLAGGVALALGAGACGGIAESSGQTDPPVGDETSDDGSVPVVPDDSKGQLDDGCVDGQLGASKVRGLTLTAEVDAISLVELTPTFEARIVVEQYGEPCPDGGTGSTCLLVPEVRRTGYYLAGSDVPHALVVTIMGTHTSLGYNTARELLGEVDTPNEAAVLAWTEGWGAACSEIIEDEGGYWIPDHVGCTEGRGWVWVGRDGTVSHSAYCTTVY